MTWGADGWPGVSEPVPGARVVLSLGVGVQSSTLALMAARRDIGPMPECDTGWEPQAVYDYLEYLMPIPSKPCAPCLVRCLW